MKRHQTGATLIVVMIFLVAITVIGTIAIRQSMVALNIATNSQVQQLILQNSDSAYFNVELPLSLQKNFTSEGMFGYIEQAKDKNKELVFCYRGDQTEFFDITRASLMEWEPGKTKPTNDALGTEGYCNAKLDATGNWFTSGRKAVMTQVAVKFSTDMEKDPFYGRQRGQDTKKAQLEEAKRVRIFAVSLMPSLSSVDRADINTCLQNHMNEVTIPDDTAKPTIAAGTKDLDNPLKTVTECLSSLSVPFTTQVSEYLITQDSTT